MSKAEAELKKPADRRRNAYEAPDVRKVKLSGEEMASTGCKSTMVGVEVCNYGSLFVNRLQGS